MDKLIFIIKGVSGSGKSSRVFQLLKFFEKKGLQIEPFFIKNTKGKDQQIGLYVKDINIIFLGKKYKKNGVVRWQGFDAVTSVFGGSEFYSSFLKENHNKYGFVVEGAGITISNRLRPLFLYESGFRNIFVQYYNFKQSQKNLYHNRIIYRSGKKPLKDAMWRKCKGFEHEFEKTVNEIIDINNCVVGDIKAFYDYFDSPIYDFGVKFFEFLKLEEFIEEFKQFVEELDYININKF